MLAALAITGSMVVVTVLGLGIWPLIVLLVLNMLVTGILLPAVPVIALEANAHRAGSAAALLGRHAVRCRRGDRAGHRAVRRRVRRWRWRR